MPPQLLQITASVLLLVDLFYAWGAYYLHSLRYTVISCHICSTQNIFAVKNKLLFVQNMIFHEQVFLNTTLKLVIIRMLCTIPCSMAHELYSQPPKTYMYITVDTLDQYRMKINTRKKYMYWLHIKLTSFLKISQIGHFYWYTILHTKCQVLIVQVMLLHFQC